MAISDSHVRTFVLCRLGVEPTLSPLYHMTRAKVAGLEVAENQRAALTSARRRDILGRIKEE